MTETVAQVVKAARKRLGWTAKELSRRARLSQQFICDLEQGRRRLGEKAAEAIERALEMDRGILSAMDGRLPRKLGLQEAQRLVGMLSGERLKSAEGPNPAKAVAGEEQEFPDYEGSQERRRR